MQFKDDKEIRALDNKALEQELNAISKFLNGLKFENSGGNLKDTSQLKKARRHKAFIRGIQEERKKEAKVADKAAKTEPEAVAK